MMQQTDQIALIERALRHIDQKTTDRGESFAAVADFYNSPDQLKQEEKTLFTQYPLVAGFSSQVSKTGDFFVFEFGSHSILVVRGEDGKLNALSNFCEHRGTKLATGSGSSRRFVCPYHAWSYGTDGRLISAPHKENFTDIENCHLKRFPVAEKYGLVWVRPQLGGPELNLEKDLGPLAKDLESFGFDTHVQFAPKSFHSPINWKLMIEASLETYHFKYTHQKTIAPMFFDDLGAFDWSGINGRMFLPKQSIKELKDKPKDQWNIREVGNLIYFFFPNTVLLVQPDHATWMSSFPVNERESLIQGGTLIPSVPATEKAEKYWMKNVDIFWQAIDEDYTMSEKIQQGLNSGYVDKMRFGRTEFLVRHFHDEIQKALR